MRLAPSPLAAAVPDIRPTFARLLGVAILIVVSTVISCRNGDGPRKTESPRAAPTTVPSVVLHPPGRAITIRVEVVRTSEDRQRGLMYRNKLDADAGMVFLWEQPQHLSFWMKNTFIPLDMIFIGANRRIVGIVHNAEPRTESSRSVAGDSQFVLEINGGLSARMGLAAGQPVDFVGFVAPADLSR